MRELLKMLIKRAPRLRTVIDRCAPNQPVKFADSSGNVRLGFQVPGEESRASELLVQKTSRVRFSCSLVAANPIRWPIRLSCRSGSSINSSKSTHLGAPVMPSSIGGA
jgi:hypothetical protein